MQQNSENLQPAPVPQPFPLPAGQVPLVYNRTQTKVYNQYRSKCVLGMSITLIILGIVCIIVQSWNFFLPHINSLGGSGIWGGFWCVLTGSFGVVSSKKRTLCPIVTFMVLCILGSILVIAPLGVGGTGFSAAASRREERNYNNKEKELLHTSLILNAILLSAASIVFLLMIISACCTCKAVCKNCCPEDPKVMTPGQVHYMTGPNGETQVVIMPVNQPMAASHFPSSTSNPGYIHPGPPTGSAPPDLPPPYEECASPPDYEKKA